VSSATIVAAGCLVTRQVGPDTEVLLVHRPKYDDWSLPKGRQEPHEHVIETAVREVQEESGLVVALRQPLPARHYKVSGQPKTVHYWRAELLLDKGFAPNHEVDQVCWLPMKEARAKASNASDAELITLAKEPMSTPFVVLRHGHATKRAAWSGDDLDRPLDSAGVTQAEVLPSRLAAYGLRRVHSSAARRCVDTVTPYAEQISEVVVTESRLTEDAFNDAPDKARERVALLLAESARSGQPTLLCGHRPSIPALVDHLLQNTELHGPHETVPVASMIVLHTHRDGTVHTLEHHLPPP
jgi:8-oxo-(d)GTP phosphatase